MTLKIGCFGSVLTFAPEREICQACELRDACAKRVFEREPKVTQILTLRETERGKKDIAEVDSKALDDMQRYFGRRRKKYLDQGRPKANRTQRDYQAMIDRGIDFIAISRGINPINEETGTYAFIRHGIDYILAEKFFKASDIQQHLLSVGDYGNASTARVYANRIISILIQSGNVKKEGKVYCLQT